MANDKLTHKDFDNLCILIPSPKWSLFGKQNSQTAIYQRYGLSGLAFAAPITGRQGYDSINPAIRTVCSFHFPRRTIRLPLYPPSWLMRPTGGLINQRGLGLD